MTGRLGPLIVTIAAASTVLQSCGSAGPEPDIRFVDQAPDSHVVDPLALVVSIDAGGKLTLNQIETGTIANPAVLNEKLRTIIDDRRRSSVYENEVLIEMVGTIAYEDIDALISSLKPLELSRITVAAR